MGNVLTDSAFFEFAEPEPWMISLPSVVFHCHARTTIINFTQGNWFLWSPVSSRGILRTGSGFQIKRADHQLKQTEQREWEHGFSLYLCHYIRTNTLQILTKRFIYPRHNLKYLGNYSSRFLDTYIKKIWQWRVTLPSIKSPLCKNDLFWIFKNATST